MNDWTLGSFLFWLAVVIAVPGVIIHFTLGRRGGHHLFDKDGLSADELRRLPLTMTGRRIRRDITSSAATLTALVVVLALYPAACLIGVPINVLGIAPGKLVWWLVGGVAVVMLVAMRRGGR